MPPSPPPPFHMALEYRVRPRDAFRTALSWIYTCHNHFGFWSFTTRPRSRTTFTIHTIFSKTLFQPSYFSPPTTHCFPYPLLISHLVPWTSAHLSHSDKSLPSPSPSPTSCVFTYFLTSGEGSQPNEVGPRRPSFTLLIIVEYFHVTRLAQRVDRGREGREEGEGPEKGRGERGGNADRGREGKAQRGTISRARQREWKQQREQTASPPSAQGGLPGHGGGHLISMKETRDLGGHTFEVNYFSYFDFSTLSLLSHLYYLFLLLLLLFPLFSSSSFSYSPFLLLLFLLSFHPPPFPILLPSSSFSYCPSLLFLLFLFSFPPPPFPTLLPSSSFSYFPSLLLFFLFSSSLLYNTLLLSPLPHTHRHPCYITAPPAS
ncbi:hypothetical protein C7M84_005737 [Penaeus vannamei]|uniref:Uncharacterized protein n=1 Tax=Penaeus vannamei TaxID=6689 RepID=A0A3R7M9I2_PENVA|nr:hypothetical protein C7M84_005737 [Penaeus vannamei]